jgi:hypothetical protein
MQQQFCTVQIGLLICNSNFCTVQIGWFICNSNSAPCRLACSYATAILHRADWLVHMQQQFCTVQIGSLT